MKQFLFTAAYVITGSILSLLFNFLLLDSILIPDPCYYHSHDTGWLFDLFYNITTAEGGHPSPSLFNLVFTIATGGAIGYAIARYVLRARIEKSMINTG